MLFTSLSSRLPLNGRILPLKNWDSARFFFNLLAHGLPPNCTFFFNTTEMWKGWLKESQICQIPDAWWSPECKWHQNINNDTRKGVHQLSVTQVVYVTTYHLYCGGTEMVWDTNHLIDGLLWITNKSSFILIILQMKCKNDDSNWMYDSCYNQNIFTW